MLNGKPMPAFAFACLLSIGYVCRRIISKTHHTSSSLNGIIVRSNFTRDSQVCKRLVRPVSLALLTILLEALTTAAHAQTDYGRPTPMLLQTDHPWLATPDRRLRLSLGMGTRSAWRAPISGLQGDLLEMGIVRADWTVASRVIIQLRGTIRQRLKIDEQHSAPVAGYPQSGTTEDVGDFSLATVLRFYENKPHTVALGLQFETKLPNSTQVKGIGTNTTDINLSALLAARYSTLLAFASAGIGILQAPLEIDEQNDVFLYGIGLTWALHRRWELAGEINGWFNTRNLIPLGTESRGALQLGVTWRHRELSVETMLRHGVTVNEGNWGVAAAFAVLLP